ncbi:hypothetical protein Cgig2_033624 [Carnegiea gigantea]|uniref:DUF4283 domain-containing protein n=1 Tax=Carnegiea gigantea TaxID=171969 RepID=A0A9Q1K220_9CARY|nr:hypothetical protein Cgig2_033624 [Carnegiea gigantea]
MVDLDEGNSLDFIPVDKINGVACTDLESEDVKDEIAYWSSSVLCSVLGANPPFVIIQAFIKRIWAQYEIEQILLVRNGIFLVRFKNIQDKQTVEKGGFYFFDNKLFVVKRWNANLDMNNENLHSLPLWIRLPNLELKYWGKSSLSKIRSLIGIPIKTYQYTKSRSMIQFARMLIEVPIEGPFPEFVEFFNEVGSNAQTSPPELEVPAFASHTQSNAPSHSSMEIQRASSSNASNASTSNQVQRKQATSPSPAPNENHIIHHNPFQEAQWENLWKDLKDIAQTMDEAWCLMGDFNTLRFKDDRVGGNEVQDNELCELATLLEACELHELKSTGAYFSWTNRSIWSRIDHVFLNDL